MNRALVIADDLTGAAEIGGIAHHHGLRVTLIRGEAAGASETGLTVVDTDSRNVSDTEAGERVRDVICQLATNFELIYKKADSVLRGPVRAELEALLDALGLNAALLVPQNPSRGRTIRDGKYFIENVPLHLTEFARDPNHPVQTCDVRELLGDSTRITIGNGVTLEDLKLLAHQVDRGMLAAGGADFFEAILETRGIAKQHADPLPSSSAGKTLFVCGSSAGASRLLDQSRRASLDVCPMPDAVFQSGCAARADLADWRRTILSALAAQSKAAVLLIPQPLESHRNVSSRLQEALAEVVANVVSQTHISRLNIEGGETGASICRRLGWNRFQVEGELASGIVQLRLDNSEIRIILKPGSYTWPDSIFTSLQ